MSGFSAALQNPTYMLARQISDGFAGVCGKGMDELFEGRRFVLCMEVILDFLRKDKYINNNLNWYFADVTF
jgi:hypothetical protein